MEKFAPLVSKLTDLLPVGTLELGVKSPRENPGGEALVLIEPGSRLVANVKWVVGNPCEDCVLMQFAKCGISYCGLA
jgi:hypothetical protein